MGCVGPRPHLLGSPKGKYCCPDFVEQIMLLLVAGEVGNAGEAIKIRKMRCCHFYSTGSSAEVADGELYFWDPRLIAIKALKKTKLPGLEAISRMAPLVTSGDCC